jgi:diadenosine tetraphosphate (Ap4A) HIT family hydrolase
VIEQLWAGWRREYVESAATLAAESAPESAESLGEDADGSIFTRILASGRSDTDTHIVWRGSRCFAILNAYPYTNGHLLVMPYREVADVEALEASEFSELWAGVRMAITAIKAAYRPDGLNVGMNLGRAAGAGVPTHLHVHVLPRWSGDTNTMTAVAGVRVMPETLASSAARLRAAWPEGSGGDDPARHRVA